MYTSNTLTSLSEDLKDNDTIVHLNNISNWHAISTTESYYLGFIFWNYQDSNGYQYPENTYSQNVWNRLYTYDKVNFSNNTIELSKPWNHGTVPAGTKLSQPSVGGFNYGFLSYKHLSTEYQTLTFNITGIISTGKVSPYTKFRPGTKYINLLILHNFNNTVSNPTIYIKDFEVREV